MKKYQVNKELVEPFEVESAEEKQQENDSNMRRWLSFGLLFVFITLTVGGLILSFKNNDADIFKALLSTTQSFVAIAVGYYFGKQKTKRE